MGDVLNLQIKQLNLRFADFVLGSIARIRQNVSMVLFARGQTIIVINVSGCAVAVYNKSLDLTLKSQRRSA